MASVTTSLSTFICLITSQLSMFITIMVDWGRCYHFFFLFLSSLLTFLEPALALFSLGLKLWA